MFYRTHYPGFRQILRETLEVYFVVTLSPVHCLAVAFGVIYPEVFGDFDIFGYFHHFVVERLDRKCDGSVAAPFISVGARPYAKQLVIIDIF